MECDIFSLILRRKRAIKSPQKYQSSMICTGSTIAAVYFPRSNVTERLQHVGENVVA